MKKYICFILTFLLLLCLAGCGGEQAAVATTAPSDADQSLNNDERSGVNVVETDPETGETYYLLANFENYFECSQIKNAADLGTITMISKAEQPDKVTYGEGSIRLVVSGYTDIWRKFKPHMRIPTTGEAFNLTTDFSNMDRLTFDIYNCQDYPAQIRIFMSADINPRYSYPDLTFTNANNPNTILHFVELEPGWNHIEVPAEAFKTPTYDSSAKLVMLSGPEALSAVGAFCIYFDRGELHEVPEEFYLDNIRAYLTD